MEAPREKMMHYRALDPARIINTAELLGQRVSERFPSSGLRKVAAELVSLSRDVAVAAKAFEAPIWWLRIAIAVVILIGASVVLFVGTFLSFERISTGAFDFVQGIEASLNTFLLAGLGFLALVRAEERLKRKRVFKELHGLRTVCRFQADEKLAATHHQQRRSLPRYLDYCSEMLSITGKLAALFAQSVNDEVVVDAVNSVEELGSNLSRKIWQKITMVEAAVGRRKPTG
jgi:hypothetical protein